MKIKLNIIYNLLIIFLVLLLIAGYLINKKNSFSKKNEIFNLTQQIITKNNQIAKIQKNLLSNKKNINDFVNLKNINFQKTLTDKKLKNFNNFKISKYKTNEILFSGNYNGLGSAYIDFYNNDKELILATVDGIFATAKIKNLESFSKIKSNIFDLITYDDFYTDYQYGIKDILVYGDNLYVSFINRKKEDCYNLKILVSKIDKRKLNFKNFYETSECVDKNNKHGYLAHQGAGGRIVKLDNSNILFTTGDFRNRPLAQNLKSDFGKILKINTKNRNAKVISSGHRNPQGLYYSKKFNFIISTEHGPKGGDEVNINLDPLIKIKNFGWPISSYGEHYYKNYSKKILQEAPLNKSHKKFGFKEPIKYFVPSIGISQIIPFNDNDTAFLIGAMGNEIQDQDLGLHLILLNEKRQKVINHKYTLLNERVRDMIISRDRKTVIIFLESTSSLLVLKRM